MLVGREAELGEVGKLLAAARLGRGGGLLLSGEPGVGKTTLVDEAARAATGMSTLRATGRQGESVVAFGALLELLRPALPLLPRIPAPQREALAVALALEPGGRPSRFAVGSGVLNLLSRRAEPSPLLVVLDDLQWFDRPSLDAIAFAVGRLGNDPVAVLAGTRPTDGPPPLDLPLLPLTGLAEDASAAMLAGLRPAVPGEQARLLHRATGGNPLAMLELARDPAAWARLSVPGVPLAAPEAVARAFADRVAGLSAAARSTLLAAAVAGPGLRGVVAVARLLDLGGDRLAGALGEAESAGLVVLTDGAVEFRHPLVLSAVYADADPSARRQVHRAVADLPEISPDQRAWHLAEAAVLPDEPVAAGLVAVADRATARSAHAVAAAALERAAALSPAAPVAQQRLLWAATSAWLAGRADRAGTLLDRVEVIGPPPPAALALRGRLAAHGVLRADACALLVAAAEGSSSREEAVRWLADAVVHCVYCADGDTAVRLADRLRELLRDPADVVTTVLAEIASGMARTLAGSDEGPGHLRAAVDLVAGRPEELDSLVDLRSEQPGSDALGWVLLGPMFLRDAEGQPVRDHLAKVRHRAATGLLPSLLFQLARDRATTDCWQLARAAYADAIRLAGETGQVRDLVMARSGLAWLESRCGNLEVAERLAAEAADADPDSRVRLGLAWRRFAAGEALLAAGRPEDALAELDRLEEFEREIGLADVDISPSPERVEALCALGRRDAARTLAEGYALRAERKGQPWACARALRALGTTAPADELDERFGRALGLHARTPDGFETARTRLAYGARLRRDRRRRDARVQLRLAVAAFDQLGAAAWAERADAELAATGETAHRREVGAAERLTPQELQVVTLLVEGSTTREAAAALYLSPKTVEYHLRKVYLKLGVNTREALAEALRRG